MRQIGGRNQKNHLVWNVFPEPFCGRLWGLEPFVAGAPFGSVPALFFCITIPDLGVLLLGGCDSRDLWFLGLSVMIVLS